MPLVAALITTAGEALQAIMAEPEELAALKTHLVVDDDMALVEAESNANDFVSELSQYIEAS